jgi:hypothetical protein
MQTASRVKMIHRRMLPDLTLCRSAGYANHGIRKIESQGPIKRIHWRMNDETIKLI